MSDSPTIVRRRRHYRPSQVSILLVGESAPAGGTHYYLANSALYRGIRRAIAEVQGSEPPEGEEFLEFARELGIWLIDLAPTPVNYLVASERTRLTDTGIGRVATLIRQCRPERVVAIKMSLRDQVRHAITRSGLDVPMEAVHFAGSGWQNVFVQEFSRILRKLRFLPSSEGDPTLD